MTARLHSTVMSQERADATLAQVGEWGINHIHTAASYGVSEDRLRSWLALARPYALAASDPACDVHRGG